MKHLFAAALMLWASLVTAEAIPSRGSQAASATVSPGAAIETPVFVKVLPDNPSARDIQKAAAEEREKAEKLKIDQEMVRYSGDVARDTNRMFWATVWLFGVTALLFAVAVFQALVSRRAVNAAVDSGKIAAQAVELSEKNAERQLRAYLFMAPATPFIVEADGRFLAHLRVKNCGQTPAHDVVLGVQIALGNHPLDEVLIEPEPVNSRGPLAPGESLDIRTRTPYPPRHDQFELAAAGGAAFYIYGTVAYVDIFDRPQRTTFCLCSTGEAVRTGHMMLYSTGNHAT